MIKEIVKAKLKEIEEVEQLKKDRVDIIDNTECKNCGIELYIRKYTYCEDCSKATLTGMETIIKESLEFLEEWFKLDSMDNLEKCDCKGCKFAREEIQDRKDALKLLEDKE